jgi:hypothetical protein
MKVLKWMQNRHLACINYSPNAGNCIWPFRLGLLLICLWFIGCTPNSDTALADYRDRLERTLKLELPAPTALKAPMPELSDSPAIPISDIRLDLLDMLALDSCGLQPNQPSLGHLIAERNSSLGKVMAYSSQLQYEMKLLRALTACLKDKNVPIDLRATLANIFAQKQQQLPARLLNFLLRDPQLRQQIYGSQRPLDLTSGQGAETLIALQNLLQLKQKLLDHNYQEASVIDINQQLAVLYQGQVLADLQHSLRSNLTQLQTLNQQLKLWNPAWCKAETQTILQQVLAQVFIAQVQRQFAHQDGIAQQLIPTLIALYADTVFSREIESRFYQPWQQLHSELKIHIGWWQQLQSTCVQ